MERSETPGYDNQTRKKPLPRGGGDIAVVLSATHFPSPLARGSIVFRWRVPGVPLRFTPRFPPSRLPALVFDYKNKRVDSSRCSSRVLSQSKKEIVSLLCGCQTASFASRTRTDHFPSQLSGGQQQRVAIARALVNRPPILLADEPTGNLDSRTSVEIMEIFQTLNEGGLTIILVTHETDIANFARRCIVFRDGTVRRDELIARRSIAAEVIKTIPRLED